MTDIRTTWSGWAGDWQIAPPALADGADLETAVLLSLFSDARAAADDALPGKADERRGWWAGPLGSRLWLLQREKATNDTRLRAEDYVREALAWMLQDEVADHIEVAASYAPPPAEPGRLDILVTISRFGAIIFAHRFGWVWQQAREVAHAVRPT